VMNCDQGSYAESPTLYAAYVARAAVSDRKLCCGSGAVAPSEWRCRIWVNRYQNQPIGSLPLIPQQRKYRGHRRWSGSCQFQTHAPRQKAQCVGRVLTSSRRADDSRCAPDGRRKQGLQTPPSLERTMAATALYVRCSSRAVSSLGMSSITSCPHASSSCHQRRSPALA
jgi:hypothetical protein